MTEMVGRIMGMNSRYTKPEYSIPNRNFKRYNLKEDKEMSFLDMLNLRTEEIDRVVDKCDTILAEAKDLARKFGINDDYMNLLGFLDKEALEIYNNNDPELETNRIIDAYFIAIKNRLAKCNLFEEFDITFESYTNGLNSELFINYKGNSKYYNYEGDLYNVLMRAFIDPVYNNISKYLEGTDKNYPKDWVEDDLTGDEFDAEDIIECIYNNKITGSIKKLVDEFATKDEK